MLNVTRECITSPIRKVAEEGSVRLFCRVAIRLNDLNLEYVSLYETSSPEQREGSLRLGRWTEIAPGIWLGYFASEAKAEVWTDQKSAKLALRNKIKLVEQLSTEEIRL